MESNKVFKIIDDAILSKEIFINYEIFEHKLKKIKSPAIITQYDSIYINKNIDK